MLNLFQNEKYNLVVSRLFLPANLLEKNCGTCSFTDICIPATFLKFSENFLIAIVIKTSSLVSA